jgi:predicted amidohydrolase
MSVITVGAAQLGPIARVDSRGAVVKRLLAHLHEAKARGCDLVVFPELALTTFFPRWWMEDQAEIDAFFEREMPGPETRPLFEEAARLGLGFCIGYAELAVEGGVPHRYNTAILVDAGGRLVGKYRKIHLPGHAEHEPQRAFQHLEKRYFEVGNLGFGVWRAFGGVLGMCICNDRRWPETYRVMGLQGVEMVLLGYNTRSRTSTTSCRCRPAPTRTPRGWWAWPRPGARRAATSSASPRSSRPPARRWPWRAPSATSS